MYRVQLQHDRAKSLRFILTLVVIICALGTSAPTWGERAQRPGASELLRAMDLIREGRCDAAIPLLRQANEIGDLRNALWNLAECYALMSRPRLAIEAYQQYMEHNRTNAQDRVAAQRAIERIEATMTHIEISANVEGARVRVNGLDEGVTPTTVEVGPGTCAIEVISPGFRAWQSEMEVGAGQEYSLSAELELAPGELSITSNPPGAEVWIDGERRDGLTPWQDEEISGGGHVVELKLEGFRDVQRQVSVNPAERTSLEFRLRSVEGTLVIASNATEATLLVDGEERGQSPFTPLDLDPGHYGLEVRAEDHGDWSGEVDVFDQRTTRVELELPSTEGVHRAWFWTATGVTTASFSVAVVLGIIALFYNGELQAAQQAISGDHDDPFALDSYRAEGLDNLDKTEAYTTASWSLFAIAGVGALSMFFLGLFTRFNDPPIQLEVTYDDTEDISTENGLDAGEQRGTP